MKKKIIDLFLRLSGKSKQFNHLTIQQFLYFHVSMIQLTYPSQRPAIKTAHGREYIFCIIRKRWYLITPEEWVRQNFLNYLIHVLHYPASLIAVEKQLLIGDLKKRFDVVVYKNSLPLMIIECKEMDVPLSEKTVLQVLRYNSNVQAQYIVVTNGNYCAAYANTNNQFIETDTLPPY